MGKIFYIMGKSASGKDRIYSLLAAHKELNLKTLSTNQTGLMNQKGVSMSQENTPGLSSIH